MINTIPELNMRVVLQETGLKADILRAWERRYGLPRPQRTQGGHRLYSEYDVAILKWLQKRIAEGYSISRAVELWQQLEKSGRDPLVGSDAPIETNANLDHLRRNWIEACLAFNETLADETLKLAYALYPVESVCSVVLQQGLQLIGEYWYTGQCSVQQEHFTSALVVRHLGALISAVPAPIRSESILIGCPATERHFLPALFTSLYLRRAGYRVTYLGADIPDGQLSRTVEIIAPNLVILIAQQLTTAAALRFSVVNMNNLHIATAYGGRVFTRLARLRDLIPAAYLGDRLELVVQNVNQLFDSPRQPGGLYGELALPSAKVFKTRRALVEMSLYDAAEYDGVVMTYMEDANRHFGNVLEAALDLGDLTLLDDDLQWLTRFINSHHIPTEELLAYLCYYRQAVVQELAGDGEPITAWLDSYLARHSPLTT